MLDLSFYNARYNRYLVATPSQIRELVAFPERAQEAADSWRLWSYKMVAHIRAEYPEANGLLVGPFVADDELGLLIVNTTGDLAERSGNGLTIFSQFLAETHQVGPEPFSVTVYHDRAPALAVQIEPVTRDGESGFWIDMGVPEVGHEAVRALAGYGEDYEHNGRSVSRVFALESIDPAWIRSVLVSVDNPHCVTFLETEASLLALDDRQGELAVELAAIADREVPHTMSSRERPCAGGINLQWAFVGRSHRVMARVFERGEGWTRSSGSSATAVAWAARHLGFSTEAIVSVEMLGGTPTIQFDDQTGRTRYFGVAVREDKLKADPTNSVSERLG